MQDDVVKAVQTVTCLKLKAVNKTFAADDSASPLGFTFFDLLGLDETKPPFTPITGWYLFPQSDDDDNVDFLANYRSNEDLQIVGKEVDKLITNAWGEKKRNLRSKGSRAKFEAMNAMAALLLIPEQRAVYMTWLSDAGRAKRKVDKVYKTNCQL